LEPWEQVVPLEGAAHNYAEKKVTRVWGRRRLKLIEGLLPFADAVDVFLKGRALPSFYAVQLPGMTFVLGLTGWSGTSFTGTGGFDLLAEAAEADDGSLAPVRETLRRQYHLSVDEVAQQCGIDKPAASRLLVRLCRQGRCMFDVQTRRYRHRELFEQPADEAKLFPPDVRRELAWQYLDEQRVDVRCCQAEETVKRRRLRSPRGVAWREVMYRDWRVTGAVAGMDPVEVVVNDAGSIIFGRCTCPFFREHMLNQGPCEHMLALFKESEPQRKDGASSTPADAPPDSCDPSEPEEMF
jgi:hypothetical protein